MSETEKLIELVRERSLLYDLSDSNYKNRDKKAETWREIAREMGNEDGKYWSIKWKNLKDNYNKSQKITKTVTGQRYKKYKNWPWADLMRFLDDFKFTRTTETNTNISETEEPNGNDSPLSITEDINSTQRESELREFLPETNAPCESKRKKPKQTEEPSDRILEYLKKKNEQKQFKTMDEADYFFLSYAQSFKKFSPRTQAMLKLDIATLFARYELQAAGTTSATIPEMTLQLLSRDRYTSTSSQDPLSLATSSLATEQERPHSSLSRPHSSLSRPNSSLSRPHSSLSSSSVSKCLPGNIPHSPLTPQPIENEFQSSRTPEDITHYYETVGQHTLSYSEADHYRIDSPTYENL